MLRSFILWSILLPLAVFAQTSPHRVDHILKELHNAQSDYVIVVAHRGDWRNAPENSIQAIRNAIKMGVDVVEIDVRKTKDNQLVIIHDKSLNRTTNGTGLVEQWTLDSLKGLFLKDGLGIITHHRIPTLKEALIEAKGKILVNLDKCYNYLDEAYKIIEETGTQNQIIIKGYNVPVEKVKKDLKGKEKIIYMPIISFNKTPDVLKVVFDFQKQLRPLAVEIASIDKEDDPFYEGISTIKKQGSRVWFNSLWPEQCANHNDEKAVDEPNKIYGWYIQKGVNIIQTDRPQLLIEYLRSRKLHD